MALPSVGFVTSDDFQTSIRRLASHNHFYHVIILANMNGEQLMRICEIILSNHIFIDNLVLMHQKNLFRYGEKSKRFNWSIIHQVKNLDIDDCLVQDLTNFRDELCKNKSLQMLHLCTDVGDVTNDIIHSNISKIHVTAGAFQHLNSHVRNNKLRVLSTSLLCDYNDRCMPVPRHECDKILAFITQNRIMQLTFYNYSRTVVSQSELRVFIYNYTQIADRIRENVELDRLSREMCKSAAIHLYGCLRHINPLVFNKDVTRIISKLVMQTSDENIWRDTYKQKIQKHYY